jgi:hypothetical protein
MRRYMRKSRRNQKVIGWFDKRARYEFNNVKSFARCFPEKSAVGLNFHSNLNSSKISTLSKSLAEGADNFLLLCAY